VCNAADWDFRVTKSLHNASQALVYEEVARRAVSQALDGFNATILAYGQTGSGKSYSMYGATESYEHRGIVPRAINEVFAFVADRDDREISISISYMEIYNEQIRDLLVSPELVKDLPVYDEEGATTVKGLTLRPVYTEAEALNLLFEGETNRAISAHAMNKRSSRSHCIFTVYIDTISRVDSDTRRTVAKLNFVDLAGSERLDKTFSEGRTQQEAMYINKSLTFLEQVTMAVGSKGHSDFVPFRQTKLTHFLKDSIGGNSYTSMVANIWATREQIDESLGTLRFAQRMASISNTPRMNVVDDAAAVIARQKDEIAMLTAELKMRDILAQRSPAQYGPFTHGQKAEVHAQVAKYLGGELQTLPVTNIRQVHEVYREFKAVVTRLRTTDSSASMALSSEYGTSSPTSPTSPTGGVHTSEHGQVEAVKAGAVGELGSSGFSVGPVDDGKSAAPRTKQAGKAHSGAGGKDAAAAPPGGDPDAEIRRKLILVVEESSTPRSIFSDSEKKTRVVVKDLQKIIADAGYAKKVLGTAADAGTAGAGEATKDVTTQLEELKEPMVTVQDFIAMLPPATVMKDFRQLSRDEAFEEYQKNLGGKELAAVLSENKTVLQRKLTESRAVAVQINAFKGEIDKLAAEVAHMESFYPTTTEGEIRVMDEPVFQRTNQINTLKAQYRQKFGEHQAQTGEISYIEQLISQCREKLLLEFAEWFAEVGSASATAELSAELEAITVSNGGSGGGKRSTVGVGDAPKGVSRATHMFRQTSKIALRFMNPIGTSHATEQQTAYDSAKNATIRRTTDPSRRRRLSMVAARTDNLTVGEPLPGIAGGR
jgi:kinesin family protein 6/9